MFQKSHRQTQCTSHLACKDCVLFVWFGIYFPWCGWQHPKRKGEVLLMQLQSFVNVQSHEQGSDGVRSGDSKESISVPIQN